MIPFHTVVVASLTLAVICTIIIVTDILIGNNQQMMIMNFVYPITALYAGPFGLLVYYTLGRKSTKKAVMKARKKNQVSEHKQKPFWQKVFVGALHCGSGCTIGDIIAESLLIYFPLVLFGKNMYGAWLVDFMLAFGIGILFQYYSIKPMKKSLSAKEILVAALKADTLSLTFWQIGMYGWMGFASFIIFNSELKATEPMFWFMMQIAMFCGFITAYPVNWWLLRKNIKEAM